MTLWNFLESLLWSKASRINWLMSFITWSIFLIGGLFGHMSKYSLNILNLKPLNHHDASPLDVNLFDAVSSFNHVRYMNLASTRKYTSLSQTKRSAKNRDWQSGKFCGIQRKSRWQSASVSYKFGFMPPWCFFNGELLHAIEACVWFPCSCGFNFRPPWRFVNGEVLDLIEACVWFPCSHGFNFWSLTLNLTFESHAAAKADEPGICWRLVN